MVWSFSGDLDARRERRCDGGALHNNHDDARENGGGRVLVRRKDNGGLPSKAVDGGCDMVGDESGDGALGFYEEMVLF